MGGSCGRQLNVGCDRELYVGAVEGCTEVGAVRRSSGRDQCVGEVGRRCMWSSVIEQPVEVAGKIMC